MRKVPIAQKTDDHKQLLDNVLMTFQENRDPDVDNDKEDVMIPVRSAGINTTTWSTVRH